jgi:hypothetical protein
MRIFTVVDPFQRCVHAVKLDLEADEVLIRGRESAAGGDVLDAPSEGDGVIGAEHEERPGQPVRGLLEPACISGGEQGAHLFQDHQRFASMKIGQRAQQRAIAGEPIEHLVER